MSKGSLHAVVLAGGSGTRLWPLSTKETPKQFLKIGAKESLLKQTVLRLKGLVDKKNIWVVCGKLHADRVKNELDQIPPKQILIEPEAKNTAPAIALAAIHIKEQDPGGVMLVLPADHLIYGKESNQYAQDLQFSAEVAKKNKALVTLGIAPDHPSTGFGYIERGKIHTLQSRKYYQVRAFHEKPELQKAREFLIQGDFYWNSGMFVWSAEVFFQELEKYQVPMAQAFQELASNLGQGNYQERLQKVFEQVENISIDYALMEHAENVLVVPAEFGWDDIGNLSAFAKVLPSDDQENHMDGKVWALDASGNLAISSNKPIAMVGVKDLIVVEGKDAILVLPKEKAQAVKDLVELLKKNKEDQFL